MPSPAASKAFRHVLCVYPYREELRNAPFLPPQGLEFIAALVQPYARSLDLVDLRHEPKRTRDFLRNDTDLVCFSVNWNFDRQFLEEEIRSVPAGILTVIGGRFATENPERWLAEFPNVGVVVRGDGEEAMEEICRGVPLERIAGVSYRRDGGIVHGPNRALGPVRDDLYPDRRMRRQPYVVTIRGVPTGILIDSATTSRGCPFNCTFCSFSRNPWGKRRKWSARSPESVVAEVAASPARVLGFTDDLFTYDMDRVERICDLLLARGIRKRYIANARLEVARRPDVLHKMERAGFALLAMGIESAHDRTLKSMRKGFDTAQIRSYFKVLRRSHILMHGYFIVGNIGESVEDIRRIVPFAREIGLDTLALSTLRCGPYSGLEELVAQNPGYHIGPDGKIFSDHCSAEDLKRLRREMLSEFYSPARMLWIAHRAVRNGVLEFMPTVLPRLAPIVAASIGYAWRRSRRRARERRALRPADAG